MSSTVLLKKNWEYVKYVNSITPLHSILEPLTKHRKATITKVASEKGKHLEN